MKYTCFRDELPRVVLHAGTQDRLPPSTSRSSEDGVGRAARPIGRTWSSSRSGRHEGSVQEEFQGIQTAHPRDAKSEKQTVEALKDMDSQREQGCPFSWPQRPPPRPHRQLHEGTAASLLVRASCSAFFSPPRDTLDLSSISQRLLSLGLHSKTASHH